MTWAAVTEILARIGVAAVNAALRRGASVSLAREERGRPVHVHLSGGKLVVEDRRKKTTAGPR